MFRVLRMTEPCTSSTSRVTVGAVTSGLTVRLNTSETVPPAPSLAVTRRLAVPTAERAGVPLKTRVAVLNASQDGSALPSARVAL